MVPAVKSKAATSPTQRPSASRTPPTIPGRALGSAHRKSRFAEIPRAQREPTRTIRSRHRDQRFFGGTHDHWQDHDGERARARRSKESPQPSTVVKNNMPNNP